MVLMYMLRQEQHCVDVKYMPEGFMSLGSRPHIHGDESFDFVINAEDDFETTLMAIQHSAHYPKPKASWTEYNDAANNCDSLTCWCPGTLPP